MAALKNMGSLKKMLGMLPGMGELRDQLDSFDEREIDRIQAIIQSMTPQERTQPRILNGSRRARWRGAPASRSATSTSCSSASPRRRR
jgi:signal recognition particle subunit SRP54